MIVTTTFQADKADFSLVTLQYESIKYEFRVQKVAASMHLSHHLFLVFLQKIDREFITSRIYDRKKRTDRKIQSK